MTNQEIADALMVEFSGLRITADLRRKVHQRACALAKRYVFVAYYSCIPFVVDDWMPDFAENGQSGGAHEET